MWGSYIYNLYILYDLHTLHNLLLYVYIRYTTKKNEASAPVLESMC